MAVTFKLSQPSVLLLLCVSTAWIASILEASKAKISVNDSVELQATPAEGFQTCTPSHSNDTWGSCPPWSVCHKQKCKCQTQRLGYVKCGQNVTKLQSCHCLTFDRENVQFKLGKCMYSCGSNGGNVNELYFTLASVALNFEMCGHLNRTGTLCGQCLPHHWPLAYSYNMNCIKCPNSRRNRWKFILAAFGPVTVFYLVVVFFKVSVTQPYAYSFVFYAQVMSTPNLMRLAFLSFSRVKHHGIYIRYIKAMSSIYGMWSLDFFRIFYDHICLELDPLQIHAMEYTIALYPLLLIFLTYILMKLHYNNFCCIVYAWKPFGSLISILDGHQGNTRSLIDAYAVFYLLSITKILYVSIDLLLPVTVHVLNANGSESQYLALYFDGSKRFMGPSHLPYGILASVVVLVFIILPTMVLFFYPFKFFQVLLNRLPRSTAISLHHFVEKFQGYYKNGTGGTRDYRLFSVIYIVVMIVLFAVSSLTLDTSYFAYGCMVLILASSLYQFFQPYKEIHSLNTKISFVTLLLIALQYLFITVATFENISGRKYYFGWIVAFGLGLIPVGYICIITAYNLLKQTKCNKKLLQCYLTWKHGSHRGYSPLHATTE